MPHSTLDEGPNEDVDMLLDACEAKAEQTRELEEHNDTQSPPDQKQNIKLEDLFNDEDSDDDGFPSGSNGKKEEPDAVVSSSPPPAPIHATASAEPTDPEVMMAFYQRLFPFRLLFQWLNHAVKPSNDFGYREFAFTLQNDAYLRYQSFQTGDLLRKQVVQLNPSRFEIGPVYTANPRDRKSLRKSSMFRPISKEMVFDIDLTDYDEIRTCCDKANICHKCWSFVTMAIKVVDAALREDFGFQHIMWVYSGRRGAHAWISDKRARQLDDQRRKAIAGYLEVIRGGSQSGKKVNLKRPLHPHLARSLEILKPYFAQSILEEQDPFKSIEGAEKLLALLPDAGLRAALKKRWDAAPERSSAAKWADIDALAKSGACESVDAKSLLEAKQDIVLEYTYPRLDVEVSKKLNHLLKSPFVIHPGTGRVCVPIDLSKVDRFDPLGTPTVTELLSEIDAHDKTQASLAAKAESDVKMEDAGDADAPSQTASSLPKPDYEKTSLKPYVEYFKAHVAGVLKAEKANGSKQEKTNDGIEF